MTLRRFTAPDAALAALALRDDDARNTWVRVTRQNGSIVTGTCMHANAETISVQQRDGLLVPPIRCEEIDTIEVRNASRSREWTVASVAIVAAVALFVAIANASWLPAAVRTSGIETVVIAGCAAFLPWYLGRSRFRNLVTHWQTLFSRSA